MAYLFFIDGVPLPVTPSKMQTKIKNQNQTINLINEGEATVLKSPGLTEITFSAMLPYVKYPFGYYPNGFNSADYYLKKLEDLKVGKKPFQFICTRMSPSKKLIFNTNIKVSLEDYKIDEEAGDGQSIDVSITLKQYKSYGTKILVLPTVTFNGTPVLGSASSVRVAKSPAKTYTVVKDDSLWAIAKKQLGNGSRYPEIFNLNKDKIKNPNLIYPGQVLTLPG